MTSHKHPIGILFAHPADAEDIKELLDDTARRPDDDPASYENLSAVDMKWQRYTDMLGDLHDVIHQIGYDAYQDGELSLARKTNELEQQVYALTEFVNQRKEAWQ